MGLDTLIKCSAVSAKRDKFRDFLFFYWRLSFWIEAVKHFGQSELFPINVYQFPFILDTVNVCNIITPCHAE